MFTRQPGGGWRKALGHHLPMRISATWTIGGLLSFLVLFPVLYLLAGGPLNFIYARGWISLRTISTIGAPANWAGDKGIYAAMGLEGPLGAYLRWWQDKGIATRPNQAAPGNGDTPPRLQSGHTSAAEPEQHRWT